MKAVIYVRISKNPAKDELGTARQEKACRQLCEREALEVVAVFADDDRSAYNGKPRPGYLAMLELLPEVDVVVAWHPDRLTRQVRELEDLIDALNAAETRVVTVQSGEYDLSGYDGRMVARMLGSIAVRESEHKSARLRSKHRELAEAGKISGGGRRPYGYESDKRTIRPDEAAVVIDMAKRTLAGEALRSIALDLNARNVPSAAGGRWHPRTISTLLASPRIAGLRAHRGTVTALANWPAIVDVDTHHRLTAVLSDPARTTTRGRPPKMLTGIARCAKCGTTMKSQPRLGTAAYSCARSLGHRGCGGVSIVAEPLEELVAQAVVARLGDEDLRRAAVPAQDDEAELAELERIALRRGELAEMWAAGETSRADWTAASTALDRRQAIIEGQLRDQVRTAGPLALIVADDFTGEAWDDLTVGRQRALLQSLIEAVDIAPATRGRSYFDAGRVSIRWRA